MPWFTVEEFAALVQVDVRTETVELLQSLAEAAIKAAVGQDIDQNSTTIQVMPTDGPELILPQLPAELPSLVKVGGIAVTDWTFNSDRLYRNAGWVAYETTSNAIRPVEVTYLHGYATVPTELKRIALQAAARAYTNPSGAQQTSTTEQTGSESHTVSQSFSTNVRSLSVELTKKEKQEARRAVGQGGAYTIDVVTAYERPWVPWYP